MTSTGNSTEQHILTQLTVSQAGTAQIDFTVYLARRDNISMTEVGRVKQSILMTLASKCCGIGFGLYQEMGLCFLAKTMCALIPSLLV